MDQHVATGACRTGAGDHGIQQGLRASLVQPLHEVLARILYGWQHQPTHMLGTSDGLAACLLQLAAATLSAPRPGQQQLPQSTQTGRQWKQATTQQHAARQVNT